MYGETSLNAGPLPFAANAPEDDQRCRDQPIRCSAKYPPLADQELAVVTTGNNWLARYWAENVELPSSQSFHGLSLSKLILGLGEEDYTMMADHISRHLQYWNGWRVNGTGILKITQMEGVFFCPKSFLSMLIINTLLQPGIMQRRFCWNLDDNGENLQMASSPAPVITKYD